MGVDNEGFSAALAGGDTEVEAGPGRNRTELGRYGISYIVPLGFVLRTTYSAPGRSSAAEEGGMQLVA